MLRSMYAGVLGLQAHQLRMDVIGNNVANVNTVAYKGSRVTFQDTFAQTLQGASAPQGGRGGTNPVQIGLGVGLGSVDPDMSQGILQMTGRPTDFAIQGNGFFIVSDGQQRLYTRYGAFTRDAAGFLVNAATGMRLQGWVPDASGNWPNRTEANLTDLRIPLGAPGLPRATTYLRFGQILNAGANIGDQVTVPASAVDSLGQQHTIYVRFTKTSPTDWQVEAALDNGFTQLATITQGSGTLTFDSQGRLDPTTASTTFRFSQAQLGNGASDLDLRLEFQDVIQAYLPGPSTIQVESRDGLTAGSLESFTVAEDGTIWGQYSNGDQRPLGQIALATFANPDGLLRVGESAYTTSANSGPEQVGAPATGGRGKVAASTLEGSNVDLATEFTNMIITQRGFQANSRIITTSDEMLQDLVNIKR